MCKCQACNLYNLPPHPCTPPLTKYIYIYQQSFCKTNIPQPEPFARSERLLKLQFLNISTMSQKVPVTAPSDKAPPPLPFYSQAIKSNGLVYCSGQVALDPATNKLVEGSIADRTVSLAIGISSHNSHSFPSMLTLQVFRIYEGNRGLIALNRNKSSRTCQKSSLQQVLTSTT